MSPEDREAVNSFFYGVVEPLIEAVGSMDDANDIVFGAMA